VYLLDDVCESNDGENLHFVDFMRLSDSTDENHHSITDHHTLADAVHHIAEAASHMTSHITHDIIPWALGDHSHKQKLVIKLEYFHRVESMREMEMDEQYTGEVQQAQVAMTQLASGSTAVVI
jgi:hypothetical protein